MPIKKVSETPGCDGCPMQRLFPENNFVAPAIVPGDRIIIAEAPGQLEAEQGEPMVGATGGWLRGRFDEERGEWKGGLLGRAGIRDRECSRANTINCRPPDNKFPTDPEARSYISPEDAQRAVSHCVTNHLLPILRGRPWRRVDLLGDKALRALTGKTEGITVWRGSPLAIPALGDGLIAVPTFHPSFLARNQTDIPSVISDLKKSLRVPPEHYNTHPTLDEVKAFTAERFAFDIETVRETGEITMVGLCAEPYHAICVPFKGAYLAEIKRIFRGAASVIGQNCCQFDIPILKQHGVPLPDGCEVWDTMLMQHLLQPDMPHSLAFLGSVFTQKPAWKHLSGDDEELYCCRDVDVTFQCYQQLRPLLVQEKLERLYSLVQVPLAKICRLLHETGMTLDPRRIGVVRDQLEKEMAEDESVLPEQLRTRTVMARKRQPAPPGTLGKSGKPIKFILVETPEEEVPWRSPAVVARWLYEELRLPAQLHPKTQEVSVGKVALDWLHRRAARGDLRTTDKQAAPAGLARQIAALKSLAQKKSLIGNFCKEELLHVQRVHPHFNVHGTATGRLSSSDPNLQNIPHAARYIYVPSREDWAFLEVDFSSLENRLVAYFAKDAGRLARLSDANFNEHKFVASQFFGIPYEDVEKDDDRESPYKKAKIINHGCDGGMGPVKISRMEDMPLAEVKRMVLKWREINATTVRWQEAIAAQAKADGYLANPFGRRRYFYTDSYYTESVRTPAQSTGADICFRTMLGLLYERIGWPRELVAQVVPVHIPLPQPVRPLIQVHDSLLFEGPPQQLEEAREIIRRVAEQPWPELGGFSIPCAFKLGIPGASWGELK